MKPAKLQTLGFEFKPKLGFGQNNKRQTLLSHTQLISLNFPWISHSPWNLGDFPRSHHFSLSSALLQGFYFYTTSRHICLSCSHSKKPATFALDWALHPCELHFQSSSNGVIYLVLTFIKVRNTKALQISRFFFFFPPKFEVLMELTRVS